MLPKNSIMFADIPRDRCRKQCAKCSRNLGNAFLETLEALYLYTVLYIVCFTLSLGKVPACSH